MSDYRHTQPGTLIRVMLGLAAAGCGTGCTAMILGGYRDPAFIFGTVAAVLVATLVLFHSLSVVVSQNEITLAFGIGLVRKRIPTNTIESAGVVQNRWYYGWGIRMIPKGWLYNVSGFDAVELQVDEGRRIRIGTDQPAELLTAIQSVTPHRDS